MKCFTLSISDSVPAYWLYSGRNNGWWIYEDEHQIQIEAAYQSGLSSCTIYSCGYHLDINLGGGGTSGSPSPPPIIRSRGGGGMTQINRSLNNAVREIKRLTPAELKIFRLNNLIKGISGNGLEKI